MVNNYYCAYYVPIWPLLFWVMFGFLFCNVISSQCKAISIVSVSYMYQYLGYPKVNRFHPYITPITPEGEYILSGVIEKKIAQ